MEIKDITPANIGHFIQGNFNYLTRNDLPEHIKVQAQERAVICKPCLDNGSCTACGCKTPAVFYAPHKSCKLGKWGPMMNKAQWETHLNNKKETNGNINGGNNLGTDSIKLFPSEQEQQTKERN